MQRFIQKQIISSLSGGKVVGLFGARRTGKTFLMNSIKNSLSKNTKVLSVQGDDYEAAEILSNSRLSVLRNFTEGYDYLFVDEAQEITNIGKSLKLLVDSNLNLSIFITGSSAYALEKSIAEPLIGRMRYFNLYPFSLMELGEDFLTAKKNLETKLIFGLYPQVVNEHNPKEKRHLLESIKKGNLLKDVLSLEGNKDASFILALLRLIAFQIGNDVSYNELATQLGVNARTVVRYLNLLEKSFVLFSLPGFSRNLRKEYSKTPRYFFWDNGVRNSIIANFNTVDKRDDVGKLWENFCISERLKKANLLDEDKKHYFWRTYDKKEIDLIEEGNGIINAYEFKWKASKSKEPKEFLTTYANSGFEVINNESFYSFLK